MREDFLHFLWRTRQFDADNLSTTDGEPIEIFDFGAYNALDSGADFQNVKLKIGDWTWFGSVEMHLKSSDWLAHGHQKDAAFGSVVLHVVFENDVDVLRNAAYTERGDKNLSKPKSAFEMSKIPCLELKNRIPEGIFKKYWAIMHNAHWIPCQTHFNQVSDLTKQKWLERLAVERLERKSQAIQVALERNKDDWEETFWQFTTRYFGSKINAEPMEMLARSLPHRVLAKHKNQLFQLEALLFGQAGFLDKEFADDYLVRLKKEFQFLKIKHNLTETVFLAAWKFGRLRPPSFPTIRLAQLAGLIHRSLHLFSKVIDNQQTETLSALFEVEVSDYWRTHFVFDTPSVSTPKKLGSDTIDVILINNVAPFLYTYGKLRGDESLKDRSLLLLEKVRPEKNTLTDGWKDLGLTATTAADSQALIQLKTTYCDEKRCAACAIGNTILKV
ncbi:MAG: DUF2851 family protein [Saprospiraceae bacterium]|nr:DUF2851 family protein [Saprospiraceae bacterium]